MPPETQDSVSYSLKSGQTAKLIHEVPVLHIRLPIDPAAAESKDDRFKLFSTDGSYEKVLTVKDDRVDGDEFVDLVFDNLKVSLSYTLEVDPGAQGDPYNLFEDVPYQDVVDYYSLLEEGDYLDEAEEDEPEQEEESGEEGDWEDEEDGGSEYGGDHDDDDTAMEQIMDEEEEIEKDVIDWETFDPSQVNLEAHPDDEELDDLAEWD